MNYGFEIVCASVFTVFCIVSARVYSLLNRAYTYWDKKNVAGPRPSYIIGTWKGFAQKVLGSDDCANCKKYGKVYGTFDGLTPNLLVADPDVIKQVLVSSADSFQDIRFVTENSVVLKNSLLSLCGGEKSETQILISSLLGPQKLEKLIPKLESSALTLLDMFEKEVSEDRRINITSIVTEFINETVALTIFGIELNADVQIKDEFVKNLQKILTVKNPKSIMSLLPYFYENYFKESWIFPEKALQYFVNLIISGISESSTDILTEGKASTLIQLMVEAAEEEKKLAKKDKDENEDIVLTDSTIISKCIASMLALANATRTIVIFGIWALANNEEVQKKLSEEVKENKSEKLTNETIGNLSYLDKVVKEILRLYPFEYRLERVSTDKVKIGDIELDKNVRVSVPLYALHRVEEFYPEPEKFDPERFSESNSEKRSAFSYLPFGQAGVNGSDISLQLAVLASKITLFKILEKRNFFVLEKKGLDSLFTKGFTRIPKTQDIEIESNSVL